MQDLDSGRIVTPFPKAQNISAPHPFRLKQRTGAQSRPQVQRFMSWLMQEARNTQTLLDRLTA